MPDQSGEIEPIKEGLPDPELEALLAEEELGDRTPHTHETHLGLLSTSTSSQGPLHVHEMENSNQTKEWKDFPGSVQGIAPHYHFVYWTEDRGITSLPYYTEEES